MEWIVSNWYLIVVFAAVGFVCGISVKKWLDRPTDEQISNIKEWLLYAVTEAEVALGEKTGKLKLRMVYDMAIDKFKWLSFISFETFSGWVDEALEQMRSMIATNEHVKAIVEGE